MGRSPLLIRRRPGVGVRAAATEAAGEGAMRQYASYLVTASILAAALGVVVPLIGFGVPVGARTTVGRDAIVQSVNRTHKGNRLRIHIQMPATIERPQPIRRSPTILVGCEPLFSPLSASATNFPSRCLA